MRFKPQLLTGLEILQQRDRLSIKEQQALMRIQKGYQGELIFDRLFTAIVAEKVEFLDDIEIEFEGNRMQMDKIVASGDMLALIDIKNYQGNYYYDRQGLKIGNTLFAQDCFEQARRSRRIVERLFKKHGVTMRVVNIIIFINEEGSITINDEINEVVLNYVEIPQWLLQLKKQADLPQMKNWQQLLLQYQPSFYKAENLCNPRRLLTLKKGICCVKCGSFDLRQERYKLQCRKCGYQEVKRVSYYRTIKEHGILIYPVPIKRKEVVTFFGKNYSESTIKTLLSEYFEPLDFSIKDGRYKNDGQTFERLIFKNKKYFEQLNGRMNWKSS